MEESLFLSEPAFRDARILSGPHATLGHFTLATLIAKTAQPDLIKGLEAYKAHFDYFSCQSVRQLNFGPRCHEASKREEDRHSGPLGQEAIQWISKFEQYYYTKLCCPFRSIIDNSLLRSQFNSAVLLDIEQSPTYTPIELNSETMLPRPSNCAVILCCPKHGYLPVSWTDLFLDELRRCYPAFELLDFSVPGVVGGGWQTPVCEATSELGRDECSAA